MANGSERLGGTRTMTDVNAAAKLRPEGVKMPAFSETQVFEELSILLNLWGNIHNIKLTVFTVSQCIVCGTRYIHTTVRASPPTC